MAAGARRYSTNLGLRASSFGNPDAEFLLLILVALLAVGAATVVRWVL